jgi:hypothetical protein
VNEQSVANVMITSLDGDNRADSKLLYVYLLALYKSHESDNEALGSGAYPSVMWSADDQSTASLADMATELKYRGQVSDIG